MVKFRKYLQAHVREYWIVDPEEKTVHACILFRGLIGIAILSGLLKSDIAISVKPPRHRRLNTPAMFYLLPAPSP
ncbi:MAG: Uma2 family endonuclease [Treponema sp.]|nr:Uma2 family endonuclease [Treponema sp.]